MTYLLSSIPILIALIAFLYIYIVDGNNFLRQFFDTIEMKQFALVALAINAVLVFITLYYLFFPPNRKRAVYSAVRLGLSSFAATIVLQFTHFFTNINISIGETNFTFEGTGSDIYFANVICALFSAYFLKLYASFPETKICNI